MRLTRCLLRYRGYNASIVKIRSEQELLCEIITKYLLPTGGLEPPIFGLGDRRLIH